MNVSEDRPAVKNAADSGQVKSSKKRAKLDREQELLDLKWILTQPQGRRTVWRFLEEAKVFNSVWEPSAKIHYNAGKQDYGHWLMAEILSAHEDSFLIMMKENRKEL